MRGPMTERPAGFVALAKDDTYHIDPVRAQIILAGAVET